VQLKIALSCVLPHPLVTSPAAAVSDIAWSPSISTMFAAVSRDGHITVWDTLHLSPLIDHAVSIEPEAWAAQLAAEAAQRAAAEAAAAEEALRLRREARGEDDAASDDGEEATAMAAAAAMAVEAAQLDRNGGKRPTSAPAGGDAAAATGAGVAGAAGTLAPSGSSGDVARQAPCKKLSCVLFAGNTHVLVTGDAGGRVDIYRVVGLKTSVDVADIAGGTEGAAEGSEAHAAQLVALDAVLATVTSE
jgi:WD40 repeat protein